MAGVSRKKAIDVLRALLEHLESEEREAEEKAKAPHSRPKLLTVAEAAEALNVSRAAIYRLFSDGALGWIQVGSRRRITTSEIDRFIVANSWC